MKTGERVAHYLHVDRITLRARTLPGLTKTAYRILGDAMDRMIALMLAMKSAAQIASQVNFVVKLDNV
jgi:predicted N-acyltransferase